MKLNVSIRGELKLHVNSKRAVRSSKRAPHTTRVSAIPMSALIRINFFIMISCVVNKRVLGKFFTTSKDDFVPFLIRLD